MKPYKARKTVTLDEDLINQIESLAERDDRSFSQYVNIALRMHVEQLKSLRNQSASTATMRAEPRTLPHSRNQKD